jgi:hypothetical protein
MCNGQIGEYQYGDVHLIHGDDPSNGFLELFQYYRRDIFRMLYIWVPVCCDNFVNETAATVCRQMGYQTVESMRWETV